MFKRGSTSILTFALAPPAVVPCLYLCILIVLNCGYPAYGQEIAEATASSSLTHASSLPVAKEPLAVLYSTIHPSLKKLALSLPGTANPDVSLRRPGGDSQAADSAPPSPDEASDIDSNSLRSTMVEKNVIEENGNNEPFEIAQSVQTDSVGNEYEPVELTPVTLPRRAPAFSRFDQFKSNALYRLPGRFFFSCVTENTLRLETNVLQTDRNYRSDMIYRLLPNTTAGWALTKSTRIAWNYFLLRDQYTHFTPLLNRTFNSLGWRIDQDIHPKCFGRTNVTVGFFSRALFVNLDVFPKIFFNDLIPSITVTRPVGQRGIVYSSILGQIRFRDILNRYQEFDQFYSIGGVYRKGAWTMLGDCTLVSNFGRPVLRGGGNNQVLIVTEEFARRINPRVPIQTVIRGQQIFNMGAASSAGFAGVNCRVFGGLRATIAKPVIFPIKLRGG